MDPPIWGHYPHQANRRGRPRAVVVFGIPPVRCAQRDHPFAFAGAQEFTHHLESTGKIATDTEMNGAREEDCGQSPAGKAPVKEQQILRAQLINRFEEHLSFVTTAHLQLEAEKPFDSRQVKAERHATDDRTYPLLQHRQLNRRAIAGNHPQPLPSRNRYLLLHVGDQLPAHLVEDPRTDLVARGGKRLCAHFPDRLRPIPEVGKERIPLRLDGALYTREQKAQDHGEGELAVAGEMPGIETGFLHQVLGGQIAGECINYISILQGQ